MDLKEAVSSGAGRDKLHRTLRVASRDPRRSIPLYALHSVPDIQELLAVRSIARVD